MLQKISKVGNVPTDLPNCHGHHWCSFRHLLILFAISMHSSAQLLCPFLFSNSYREHFFRGQLLASSFASGAGKQEILGMYISPGLPYPVNNWLGVRSQAPLLSEVYPQNFQGSQLNLCLCPLI